MKRAISYNARGFTGLVVGVTSGNVLAEWWSEGMGCDWIDLSYESAVAEMEAEGKTEEEIEEELMMFESSQWLLGDWKRDPTGRGYVPDPAGKQGFSATFSNTNGDIITVEASRYALRCHHTSPCYVMTDGRPCGDLDTEGNSVMAYCLPPEWFEREDY